LQFLDKKESVLIADSYILCIFMIVETVWSSVGPRKSKGMNFSNLVILKWLHWLRMLDNFFPPNNLFFLINPFIFVQKITSNTWEIN
jgi:hypothetical protein